MQHPHHRRGARLSAVTVLALTTGLFAGGAPALADEIESPAPTAPVTEPSETPSPNPGGEPSAEPTQPGTEPSQPGESPDPTEPGTEPTVEPTQPGTEPSESPDPTEPGEDVSDVTLTDIHGGQWFFAPVSWMVAADITAGYTDGTFKPYRLVNRGEAVTFLYRYAGGESETTGEVTFRDVPTDHNYYKAIDWASEAEIVHGYNDETFRSGRSMTRGEVASVLSRMVEFDPEYQVPDTTPFSDVTKGKTAHYAGIAWLAEAGIAKGRTSTTFDPSGKITRAEFAALLKRFNG